MKREPQLIFVPTTQPAVVNFFQASVLLLRIYALFGVQFTGLNNAAVYQNGQILGMTGTSK